MEVSNFSLARTKSGGNGSNVLGKSASSSPSTTSSEPAAESEGMNDIEDNLSATLPELVLSV
jgi:hypothetical protein